MAILVVCLNMANTKPYVTVACLCENVLEDKGGVLSLIRVVDTIFAGLPPGAPEGVNPGFLLTCVIALKSGDLVGTFEKLTVVLNTPSGEKKPVTDKPIQTVFSGGAHGVQIQIKMGIEVKKFGLAWVDVMWEKELLTRIPLELKPLDQAPKDG